MKPLVSIILPTHNRFLQMKEALTSIQNQTYEHKEIIIVLDGHDEESHAYLNQVALAESNITYLLNREPKGGAEARNIGIHNSKGKYLAFLDDDDTWFADKLEKQIDFLEKNEEYAIAGCYHQKNTGDSISTFKPKKSDVTSEDLKYENYLGSFSFCIVRKLDAENITIPKELTSCQDWYYWLSVLEHCKKKAKIIPSVLVNYDSSSKESLTNNLKGRIKGYLKFYSLIESSLDSSQVAFHSYKQAKLDFISGRNKFNAYWKMLFNLVRSSYYIDLKLHLKEICLIIK